MLRITKTNPEHVRVILAGVTREELEDALAYIAYSALDANARAADTAEVVYEELGCLNIIVP